MNTVIANELKDRLDIEPDTALSSLITFACQPTKLRNVPNRTAIQREAGKYLGRFRNLCTEAVLHGVNDRHLIAASRTDLRYTVFTSGKDSLSYWTSEYTVRTHLFRVAACKLLDRAVDLAKAEKYVPVREQAYSLAELKRICAKSGSRFFKELEKGERVALEWAPRTRPGENIVKIKSRDGTKYYRFDTKIGGMIFAGNSLPL